MNFEVPSRFKNLQINKKATKICGNFRTTNCLKIIIVVHFRQWIHLFLPYLEHKAKFLFGGNSTEDSFTLQDVPHRTAYVAVGSLVVSCCCMLGRNNIRT